MAHALCGWYSLIPRPHVGELGLGLWVVWEAVKRVVKGGACKRNRGVGASWEEGGQLRRGRA